MNGKCRLMSALTRSGGSVGEDLRYLPRGL